MWRHVCVHATPIALTQTQLSLSGHIPTFLAQTQVEKLITCKQSYFITLTSKEIGSFIPRGKHDNSTSLIILGNLIMNKKGVRIDTSLRQDANPALKNHMIERSFCFVHQRLANHVCGDSARS